MGDFPDYGEEVTDLLIAESTTDQLYFYSPSSLSSDEKILFLCSVACLNLVQRKWQIIKIFFPLQFKILFLESKYVLVCQNF